MKKLILTAIMLFTCVSIISCASLPQSNSAALLVQYATLKFINSDARPLVRAKKVVEIASEAKTFFDSRELPIDDVEQLIRQKIKWSELDEADTLLVNALIERVKTEVDKDPLVSSDERLVAGSTVLGWIIKGAKLAGG